MKNVFKIALLVLVTLSLFACGNNQAKNTNKIVVALNAEFPPYEFKDKGEITGIDPDMVREIGKRLNMEVEFLDIAFDSVIPAIQNNKADLAATGLTITEDRKQFVNFTDTYQDARQSIIVKKGSPIQTKGDLEGKKIAVQTGTTGDLYCTDEFGDENMERYQKILDGVQALMLDKIDACVVDDQVAIECVNKVNSESTNGDELIILSAAYVEEHYAMALNKNNTELLDKVNEVLKEMKEDGTLKAIKEKYIKD